MTAVLLLALLQSLEDPVLRLQHGTTVIHVAFQPGGILATASREGDDLSIMAWSVEGGAPRRRIAAPLAERMDSVSFARRAPLLAASRSDGTIRVWDIERETEVSSFASGRSFARVVLSPDGRLVASAGTRIRIHDTATGGSVCELEDSRYPGLLRFSPDGRFLAAVQAPSGIGLWDAGTGRLVRVLSAAFH